MRVLSTRLRSSTALSDLYDIPHSFQAPLRPLTLGLASRAGRPLSYSLRSRSADAVAGGEDWDIGALCTCRRCTCLWPGIAPAWEQPIEERDCQGDAGQ